MDRPDRRSPELEGEEVAPAAPSRDWGDDWVHESIEMTRPGIDFSLPSRLACDRQTLWEFDDFS